MAEITAAAVKSLRGKTSLPMMECKAALKETDGNEEAAIQLLRERGKVKMIGRGERETTQGRIGIYADDNVAAIIELQCESASVAGHEEFMQLSDDLAKQLATGPGAADADALLAQPSPSQEGKTLAEQRDDLTNRTREVFNLNKISRIEGRCASYLHHTGNDGVVLQIEGDNVDAGRDICMHITAMNPTALKIEDLDAAEVEQERNTLTEAARNEGKPENIIEKMVDGRMRNYYAETVLQEQPFVKDDKQTVGQYAKASGLNLLQFLHWKVSSR
jgi:elongation factor Ts